MLEAVEHPPHHEFAAIFCRALLPRRHYRVLAEGPYPIPLQVRKARSGHDRLPFVSRSGLAMAWLLWPARTVTYLSTPLASASHRPATRVPGISRRWMSLTATSRDTPSLSAATFTGIMP